MRLLPKFILLFALVSCQNLNNTRLTTPVTPGSPETPAGRPLPPTTATESPLPSPGEKTGSTFQMGTNIKEMRDYSREVPFVDLMHSARTWYTKSPDSSAWNTEKEGELFYRADGYPTHSPQTVASTTDPQWPATIWADTTSWPLGVYTVLWEGTGTLWFGGNVAQVTAVTPQKMTFQLTPSGGKWNPSVEMTLTASSQADPVHNIRILMPGHEDTYLEEPFNPAWLEGLEMFSSLRFMDWGETNSWNYHQRSRLADGEVFTWADRASMDHYTWADGRGVPYEMMIKLMNDEGFNGWVCVPDRVDDNYITQMAALFRNTLNDQRHLVVEFSNEIWNEMMNQTHYLREFGTPSPYAMAKYTERAEGYNYDPSTNWPEKITGPLQNCLKIWTESYAGQLHRLTRVIGLQGAWKDVSRRMAFNVDPQYFDAVTQGWYFALWEADKALDQWGSKATIDVVAAWTRYSRHVVEKVTIKDMIDSVSTPLGKEMIYYEGGNHMTPVPFGVEPTYAQALEDIHRAPVMKDLYLEWLAFMRTLKTGDKPLRLWHFSYIAPLDAQYGSWGIFETLNQNTALVPAPKYEALVEAMTW